MELVLGGTSAVCAGIFTNPLEVVKIRMQLQGELQARGQYNLHYKNVFHAGIVVAQREGIFALQKGLPPALMFQFVMNGTRLGVYDMIDKRNMTRNEDGTVAPLRSAVTAALSGIMGVMLASPFFLVKTMLQSQSNDPAIAVGHQHKYTGTIHAFRSVYKSNGLRGMWRGVSGSIPRITVASAVQIATFEKSLEFTRRTRVFRSKWTTAFIASLISGFFVSLAMAPFDLIATRFYNQEVDAKGKGVSYHNVVDCARKVWKQESLHGFYKGWSANYIRVGPHTLLNLMFWDFLKNYHKKYSKRMEKEEGKK